MPNFTLWDSELIFGKQTNLYYHFCAHSTQKIVKNYIFREDITDGRKWPIYPKCPKYYSKYTKWCSLFVDTRNRLAFWFFCNLFSFHTSKIKFLKKLDQFLHSKGKNDAIFCCIQNAILSPEIVRFTCHECAEHIKSKSWLSKNYWPHMGNRQTQKIFQSAPTSRVSIILSNYAMGALWNIFWVCLFPIWGQ